MTLQPIAAALIAAGLSQSPTPPATVLDQVQVTASRVEQPLTQTLASVSVITRADIERIGTIDILDLLRRQVGIDLARTGGSGSSTSMFVRGTNSNQVLVLLDGVRVASANTGGFTWEHLAPEQIERIEIVRGPRASVWGSDALGGVIAITTRRGKGANAALRVGSNARYDLSAGWAGGSDDWRLGVQAGGQSWGGINATFPGNFSFDPDRDGYDNRNLSLRADGEWSAQRLGVVLYASDADVAFDQGESNARNRALALTVAGPLSADWSHELVLGQAGERLDTPAFAQRFDTERWQLDWVLRRALGESHSVAVGVNLLREQGANVNTFSARDVYSESRRNAAAFATVVGSFNPLEYEVALRRDDNSVYGGATTAQAGIGARFEPARVYANWGQGFRAPNLNELYSPGFGGAFAGNRDLQPERSRSVEIGIEALLGETTVNLNRYRTHISQLIAFQGQNFQAININRAEIDGIEASATRSVGAASVRVSATHLTAVDARTGLQLLRRPKRRLDTELAFPVGAQGSLSVALGYVSERRDFGGPLKPYLLTEINYRQPVARDWNLGLRIGNALDRDYQLARGFATPGREYLLTLSWNPAQ